MDKTPYEALQIKVNDTTNESSQNFASNNK